MSTRREFIVWAALLATAHLPSLVLAQENPILHSCRTTSAQLQENKRVALEFFRPGVSLQEIFKLIDPGYVQHNPLSLKMAAEHHISDYAEFKRAFSAMAAMEDPSRAGALDGPMRPTRPTPQPVIVTAECDLVTVIHKTSQEDPTAAGTKYDAFAFDTFRIRDGKFVEHWDGAALSQEMIKLLRTIEDSK